MLKAEFRPAAVSISAMRESPMAPGVSHVPILVFAAALSVAVTAASVEWALFWVVRSVAMGADAELGAADSDAAEK